MYIYIHIINIYIYIYTYVYIHTAHICKKARTLADFHPRDAIVALSLLQRNPTSARISTRHLRPCPVGGRPNRCPNNDDCVAGTATPAPE